MSAASLPVLSSATRVRDAIAQAARKTGVDFTLLYNQARVESRLDPDAKASTSSATGLFQFTKQTWLQVVKEHGAKYGAGWASEAIGQSGAGLAVADPARARQIDDLRHDPEFASIMAGAFLSDNQDQLEGDLGRSVAPVDLYLAHFLGPAGARDFLRAHVANPDAAAAPSFAAAARANRSVFYAPNGTARSFDEIRNRFAEKLSEPLDLLSGSTPPVAPLATASRHIASIASQRAPAQMLDIEPMPKHLSPELAARAYERLAGLGA